MNDIALAKKPPVIRPQHKVRFVTAASLFDGHDASINIMRRILQATGGEVIHLGHNRSVEEIVTCALQEDAHGIAISSYQGGHVEFFKYMLDLLRERGGANIKVFGGGGGVIVADEIDELHRYGVTRIFSPEDGARLGLQGMINEIVTRVRCRSRAGPAEGPERAQGRRPARARALHHRPGGRSGPGEAARRTAAGGRGVQSARPRHHRHRRRGQVITHRRTHTPLPSRPGRQAADRGHLHRSVAAQVRRRAAGRPHPHERDPPPEHLHALAGHARQPAARSPSRLPDAIAACKVAGFDLVIVETSGIGQGDAAIVPLVDVSLYVMTPEFGAASQLEKIDMLDFADFVAINKFDRKGADDALRDVRKQYQRNRELFAQAPDTMPVFGTIAARFNDDGVTALYQALRRATHAGRPEARAREAAANRDPRVDGAERHRPAGTLALSRRYRRSRARLSRRARTQAKVARERQQLARRTRCCLMTRRPGGGRAQFAADATQGNLDPGLRRNDSARHTIDALIDEREKRLEPRAANFSTVAETKARPTPATSTSSRSATRRSAPR